jgi:TRAP-type mannitol/chloroaromatic compound transport system permease small subunit
LKTLERTVNGIDVVTRWVGRVASFLIVPLIVLICYDVFMRYVLNRPTDWADELSCYLFGTMWLLGGAYASLYNAHVRMDVFYMRFSKRGRAIVDLCTSVFFFLFTGVLLWQAMDMTIISWEKLEISNSTWGPPIFPVKTMVPLGAALILLQGLAKFTRDLAAAFGWRKQV